jgi:hypothetical protein
MDTGLLNFSLNALPVQPPKQIDPVCQHNRFWQPSLAAAEGLAHAVGFAHCVRIDECDLQPSRMAERQQRLMKVRQAGSYGAAVPPASSH